ncbi:Nucleolar protein 12 [Saxophila tyrrhenica]|uniref:Nucleolar protein 12 n=1 Tax=Saxophila tyrrhenica TaxID=1690608 RepID=A0AAV9PNZ2_9PEZI|nr:Nucleolar protein 12 [Saxophila tyrrhenica]
MSRSKEEKVLKDGVEKKPKKETKKEKGEKKDRREKKDKKDKKSKAIEKASKKTGFSLLADDKVADPSLSSLFAAKPTPPQRNTVQAQVQQSDDEEADEDGADANALEQDALSDVGEAVDGEDEVPSLDDAATKRRRKRKHDEDDVEGAYMRRLAREEAKDAEVKKAERATKRRKANGDTEQSTLGNGVDSDKEGSEEDAIGSNDDIVDEDDDEDAAMSPPPKHETQEGPSDEISKANRTVFLGNVSTAAISSNSSRKALKIHLSSFFETVPAPKDGEPKHAIESIRFRSTPYASAIPKKAAYATKQLMAATAKSTNAYAIYSSESLTRAAVRKLNGSIVLGRHLRVDSVAHPSKTDHRRCVFIGNLGFVDDETNIQAANAEAGHENRKPSKQPADVEEGLWRTFGKCGTVESVRVVRDSTTRVGKGFAYVQFEDENGVEAALRLNEQKFPPMLPRKLRVTRAKAQKRNAKPGSDRPSSRPSTGTGYQRKITGEEASKIGRTGKLFGRAAAANVRRGSQRGGGKQRTGANETALGNRGEAKLGEGIRKPESFVFEGHRATSGGGKAGLKLGGRKKKPGVTGRSKAFKSKGKGK